MIYERALPELRPFQPDDLPRVLDFVGTCCAITDFCGCLHPGDVLHFISNTLRGRDPGEHLFFMEDSNRHISALVLIYPPRISGFDLMIHPNQRGGRLETALVEWAESASIALIGAEANDSTQLGCDVMDCDLARVSALRQRGFEAEPEASMLLTTRPLTPAIPESILPDGFSIRPVAGEHEAALVAEVHSGAFNSNWTAESYLKVMRSTGFEIERELVVVAPDGRFAAFTILWLDPVSQSGLFEPVGCHADFQRMGLTRALMYEGMHRMCAQGMKTAVVVHLTDNPASTGLYASVGFRPKYAITHYQKTIQT